MTRLFRSSLRSRLLLLVLLALLPALALILVTAWEQRQLAAVDAQESALRLSRLAASNQERLIEGARSLLIGLAQVPAVQPGKAGPCGPLLTDLRKRFPVYVNLSMAGPTGDITCSAVPLRAAVNVADQSYFLRARATHDFVVSGYVLEPVTGSPAVILAWPALGPTGEVRSVLFASLDLGWIHQLAERARLPLGSSFVVTDASGIVLAGYPESERSVGQPMPESEVTQAIRAQQSEAKITVESLNGRNARLFAFTAVGGGPPADRLYVSVGISRAMVFTEADRTLVRNLLSLGLVGAVALGVAAIVGHLLIIRRLRDVVRTAELVRAGDLSARAEVDGTDEIAVMGRAFNNMAERLSAMVKAEQETREGLAERVNELDHINRLGELLHACFTLQEAYAVLERELRELFRGESGAVFACSASRNLIESVARWGANPQNSAGVFAMEECWALRSGRAHVVDDTRSGPLCTHLPSPPPGAYLCTPLVAQGDALGVLHVAFFARGRLAGVPLTEAKRRLADAVGEQVALGLANVKLREVLRSQSIRDPLTGLFNRRYMEETLEREVRRAQRAVRPMAVLMLDLDHFKRVNDEFGHDAGDALLRELGNLLLRNLRREDVACRYGGEEFVLVLPEASLADGERRAEELRDEIKRLRVSDKGRLLGPITASFGMAGYPEHGLAGNLLLRAADTALYRAKREGRDRVVIAVPAEVPR
ncbi:MAG TPA: diguanylate cyclase [Candidatus Nitrosocosmicus sp.]|nr:diguanylate cyclase [Candidatus Nitrosocosmicus sp.]